MSRLAPEANAVAAPSMKAFRLRPPCGALALAQANALRRVLYGLYALVKVHFAKEEEVYLPLLDARLTPGEAHAMFEAMEAAAKEAKGEHIH